MRELERCWRVRACVCDRTRWRAPGVGILTVKADLMHTKHLGVDQYFFGSVLSVIVREIMTGDMQTRLQRLWANIEAAYQDRVLIHHHFIKSGIVYVAFDRSYIHELCIYRR